MLSTPSTPPVTDPPATTTPPPTTSPAPETTSPEAVEQEVINAYLAAWNAFNEAVKDPSDPDARAAVDATHTGASLIGANEILDQLRTSGYRSAVNRDSPARTAVESQVTL
ncbi:MAG TPA: hypothetical protein VGK49_08880, partial [Ilumatobacteraceae bacterium]